jgi:hypothetical protein
MYRLRCPCECRTQLVLTVSSPFPSTSKRGSTAIGVQDDLPQAVVMIFGECLIRDSESLHCKYYYSSGLRETEAVNLELSHAGSIWRFRAAYKRHRGNMGLEGGMQNILPEGGLSYTRRCNPPRVADDT